MTPDALIVLFTDNLRQLFTSCFHRRLSLLLQGEGRLIHIICIINTVIQQLASCSDQHEFLRDCCWRAQLLL